MRVTPPGPRDRGTANVSGTPVPPGFEVSSTHLNGGEAMVAVTGELDGARGRLVEAEIDAAFESGVQRVFVDLSRCAFIDSSGMAALIRPADRRDRDFLVRSGRRSESVAVVGAQGAVREAICWARLDSFLPLYETIDEAHGTAA